jgi:hypothetical protein
MFKRGWPAETDVIEAFAGLRISLYVALFSDFQSGFLSKGPEDLSDGKGG